MAHDSPSSTLHAVLWENRPWTTSDAYLSRTQERRHSGPYAASIPATIAELSLSVPPGVTADAEDAVREIVRFDAYASLQLGPLAPDAALQLVQDALEDHTHTVTVNATGPTPVTTSSATVDDSSDNGAMMMLPLMMSGGGSSSDSMLPLAMMMAFR